MAAITLDGKRVEAEAGSNLLLVALEHGVFIPHLCYHPGLSTPAHCRLCVASVEIGGTRELMTTCNLGVADGMVVETATPEVLAARGAALEFLLLRHPLDCPVCQRAGECELQDHVGAHGRQHTRYDGDRAGADRVAVGERISLERSRCIRCGRCVRFCREITGTAELAVLNRGRDVQVGVMPGHQVDHAMSGNLVDLCPAGALIDAQLEPGPPVWALSGIDSTCPGCARGCSIRIDVAGGRIRRLKPRVNMAVNEYWLCDEGRYGWDYVHSPQRLLQPAIREGKVLRLSSWDEALERSCQALMDAEGVAILTGGHLTNEEAFLLVRLATGSWKVELVCLTGSTAAEGDTRLPSGFTISCDRAPNAAGLRQLAGTEELDLAGPEDLWRAAREGRVRHVVVAGLGPDPQLAAEAAAQLARVETIVVVAALASPLTEAAQAVLPGCTFAERDGTFTNNDLCVQRIRPALAPPGEALQDWDILRRLASLAGLEEAGLISPAATLAHLGQRATGTCFSGMTHEALDTADPRARLGGTAYGGGWATLLQRRGFYQIEDHTK